MTDNDKALAAAAQTLYGLHAETTRQWDSLGDAAKALWIVEAQKIATAYQAALPKGQESGEPEQVQRLRDFVAGKIKVGPTFDAPELLAHIETLTRDFQWTDKELSAMCSNAMEAWRQRKESTADDLREKGWAVAVHNDYRLNGEAHTFWLFTKGGLAIKGEGRTDAEALNEVRRLILALAPLPVQGSAPSLPKEPTT